MSQTFFYHETSIPSRGSPLLCPTRSLTVQLHSKPTSLEPQHNSCHEPSSATNLLLPRTLYPPEAHNSCDEYTIGRQWRRLPTKRACTSLKAQSKPLKPVTEVLINQGRWNSSRGTCLRDVTKARRNSWVRVPCFSQHHPRHTRVCKGVHGFFLFSPAHLKGERPQTRTDESSGLKTKCHDLSAPTVSRIQRVSNSCHILSQSLLGSRTLATRVMLGETNSTNQSPPAVMDPPIDTNALTVLRSPAAARPGWTT